MWPTWKENPWFVILLSLIGFSLIGFLGVKMVNVRATTARLDKPTPLEHTIFVEGLGKATMSPDIAVMSFGISSTAKSVSDAQKQNTTLMNALIEKIKQAGILDKDLQTKDYSAYEKTEWDPQAQKSVSVGWVVSQSFEVKMRDVTKISDIVQIAGQNGSTSISGPTFTVDDQSAYEAMAREKALADAKKKAEAIAQTLGLRLERVVSYSEYKEQPGPTPYMMEAKVGGSAMPVAAPTIQSGTQDLTLHTTVTYLLEK